MSYRNGNYAAFYVDEPFSESNLGAFATRDFVSYGLLRAWKGADSTFPFIDSHDKTYNVRDGSNWELTLKPRLHERLRKSKNIILFLSSKTKNSRAVREEIDYGVNEMGLPIIVVYPEYCETSDIASGISIERRVIKPTIENLWDILPNFRKALKSVPTIHVPNKKELIRRSLTDKDFMVQTKCSPQIFFY